MANHRTSRPSRVDVAIFVTGLVAAFGSSVAAYKIVGPYGDGALDVGLYRTEDPETGVQLLYRDVQNANGTVLRYLFTEAPRALAQIQVIRTVNGKPEVLSMHLTNGALTRIDGDGNTIETDTKAGLTKVGFSVRGNGVIDAWEYRDAHGVLQKIEVSRNQDGHVDRWEYYENDQLARVEQDDNRDGRVDHWLTYDTGILIAESWDRDGDGRPDPGR